MTAFDDASEPFEEVDLYDPNEEEAEDFVPESTCTRCPALFGPEDTGHCMPNTGGCCQTFASQHAFDRHRTGPHHPPGQRRCLTVEELLAKGWTRKGRYNAWRTPARASKAEG